MRWRTSTSSEATARGKLIDGVRVYATGGYTEDEVRKCIRKAKEYADGAIVERITLDPEDESYVMIYYDALLLGFDCSACAHAHGSVRLKII